MEGVPSGRMGWVSSSGVGGPASLPPSSSESGSASVIHSSGAMRRSATIATAPSVCICSSQFGSAQNAISHSGSVSCVKTTSPGAIARDAHSMSTFALSSAAAVFGALFLMSGADGQQRVQAVFLLLAAVCLALEHSAPLWRPPLRHWLRTHPRLRLLLPGPLAGL